MQITERFTLAIHTMLCISYFSDKLKVTSTFISQSTNSNPVVIRRLLGQLKEADLIEVRAGVGGAYIKKDLKDITLFDIFTAVDAVGNDFFNFHSNPNCQCPIGKNIHSILDEHLTKVQLAMNEEMKKTNLEELLSETKEFF